MMKRVSLLRVGKLFTTAVFGTLVAAVAAQGVASAQTRETAIRTLGGPNRFSGPMHTVDDLRTMVAANGTQISSVLAQAGLGDLSTPFMNVIATGYVSDTTVAPGTHMDWMALKRAGRGSVLHNVRWTGAQAFDAFQFSVEYAGYSYTFVVPKICGNFALLSRAPIPVAAAPPPPPPAPEPPPVVQAPPPPPPPAPVVENERLYPWMATGFLGSQWATGSSSISTALFAANLPVGVNTADGGLTYGFQIGYLRKYFGGEFIGDFAPNFRMSSLAIAKDPTLNSWMFNVIGSYPIANAFQPYGSIGIGGITLRTQTFDETAIPVITVQGTLETAQNTINTARTAFGWNVGGGFFAFANQWGIRADARYYRAQTFSTNSLNNSTVPSDFTQALLSGLNYWRANLGVSFRW
jgi:opacity protein-like surface antigen